MSLTKYSQGSLRELIAVSFPLMLTSFSVLFMVFCDRWMLAHYSVEAHNAAVGAATTGWTFIFGGMVVANISEVFVAQYNGACAFKRLGEPVWQMIWFSVMTLFFFVPLSIWGVHFIYGDSVNSVLEREYFHYMVLFGPFYCLNSALSGFFIGQGKLKLITILVVIANLFNITFDWILIFGLKGWIEPMGVKGAAIATSLAMIFQCGVLGGIFLNKSNRLNFGTGAWEFLFKPFMECLKIGMPLAIFMVAELLAFAVYYAMMKDMGLVYITIAGICQSMLILFLFFSDGLNKAIAILVGNLIGSKGLENVPKLMQAGLKLNFLFLVILISTFTFCMPLIIDQFLPHADPLFVSGIRGSLEMCLILISFYLFFEGIRMQFAGVLMAAGDTRFLLITGSLSVWVLMVIPIYLFVVIGNASIETAVVIEVVYSAIAGLLYFYRTKQGKWQTLLISIDG